MARRQRPFNICAAHWLCDVTQQHWGVLRRVQGCPDTVKGEGQGLLHHSRGQGLLLVSNYPLQPPQEVLLTSNQCIQTHHSTKNDVGMWLHTTHIRICGCVVSNMSASSDNGAAKLFCRYSCTVGNHCKAGQAILIRGV